MRNTLTDRSENFLRTQFTSDIQDWNACFSQLRGPSPEETFRGELQVMLLSILVL